VTPLGASSLTAMKGAVATGAVPCATNLTVMGAV